MPSRVVLLLAVALLAVTFAAPEAASDHCKNRIQLFGRVAETPVTPPPYVAGTAGVCVRVGDGTVADSHNLPPNSGQVHVRIAGDFSSAFPTLLVVLDGAGFEQQSFTVTRTPSPAGDGHFYQMSDWATLPNGPVDDDIVVTAHYPKQAHQQTFRTSAVPQPDAPATP